MKAKLKVIKDWEFEEFELTGTSFKYSPTGCKGMVARSEDEIVFWTYHLAQKCSGVLWVKGEVSRWIPSPEPKEQQDVWEDPVLLSCDRGILLVCPASKSLWWMPQMDGTIQKLAIRKEILQAVSEQFDTSVAAVESGIRRMVDQLEEEPPLAWLAFKADTRLGSGKPTTGKLIYAVRDVVLRQKVPSTRL